MTKKRQEKLIAWIVLALLVAINGCTPEELVPDEAQVETIFSLKSRELAQPSITVQEAWLKLDRIQVSGSPGSSGFTHAINPEEPPFRLGDADSSRVHFSLPSRPYERLTFDLYLFQDDSELSYLHTGAPEQPSPSGSDNDASGNAGEDPASGEQENTGSENSDDSGADENPSDNDDSAEDGDETTNDDVGETHEDPGADNGDATEEDSGESAGDTGNDDNETGQDETVTGDEGDDGNDAHGDKDDKKHEKGKKEKGKKSDKKEHKGGDKEKDKKEEGRGKGKSEDGHHDRHGDDKQDEKKARNNTGATRVEAEVLDLDQFFRGARPGLVVMARYANNGQTINILFAVTDLEKLSVTARQNDGVAIVLNKQNLAEVSFDAATWFEGVTAGEIESARMQQYQGQQVLFIHRDFNSALYDRLLSRLDSSVYLAITPPLP